MQSTKRLQKYYILLWLASQTKRMQLATLLAIIFGRLRALQDYIIGQCGLLWQVFLAVQFSCSVAPQLIAALIQNNTETANMLTRFASTQTQGITNI